MKDFAEILKKLNDKQQEAIMLLLTGDNNKTVASKVGVDENTVYRWRNSEPFKSILLDLRLKCVEDIEIKLHSLGSKAINMLEYLLDNADNENNQLKAAVFVLDRILQYSQLELLERITSIEERLNEDEKFKRTNK